MDKNPFIDKLRLYRGQPYEVTDKITIRIPTLGEICDYGENQYYSMANTLCSVGIDLCWQLEEIGIEFDKITDYDLFSQILCNNFTSEQTKILFGDKVDFSKMRRYRNKETDTVSLIQKNLISIPLITEDGNKIICEIPVSSCIDVVETYGDQLAKVRYQDKTGIIVSEYIGTNENNHAFIFDNQSLGDLPLIGKYECFEIDEQAYYKLVACLRAMHNFKRDDRVAGTKSCRAAFIEDAKMEYEAKLLEPRKSILLPLISSLVNMEGFKHNERDVFDMNIFAFMDSVKRIPKIKNAILLLQSGYSGFGIDLKKVKSTEIDYMGELD